MTVKIQKSPTPTLPITRKTYERDGDSLHYYPEIEGVFCPIDNNPLFSIEGFDGDKYQHYRWDCLACGAFYKVEDKNPESLKRQAIWYLENIVQRNLGELRKKVAPLEAVLKSVQDKGLIK